MTPWHLTISERERSKSRSLRFQSLISRKGAELGHTLLLTINRIPYIGSPNRHMWTDIEIKSGYAHATGSSQLAQNLLQYSHEVDYSIGCNYNCYSSSSIICTLLFVLSCWDASLVCLWSMACRNKSEVEAAVTSLWSVIHRLQPSATHPRLTNKAL